MSTERYNNNKDEIIKKCMAYQREKYKNDSVYRMLVLHRTRVKREVSKMKLSELNMNSKLELLGCSTSILKKHIETQFTEGMSWDNHGIHGWHIDHIKPISKHDMNDIEDVKKAFHYTNLQPLWAKDNLQKSNKYDERSETKHLSVSN